jgi:hypothetical protein
LTLYAPLTSIIMQQKRQKVHIYITYIYYIYVIYITYIYVIYICIYIYYRCICNIYISAGVGATRQAGSATTRKACGSEDGDRTGTGR